MKRKQKIRNVAFLLLAAFFMTSFMTSCKKSNPAQGPVAGVMFINLIPDQEAVGFAIDNNSITTSPFPYTGVTSGYRNVFPGERNFASFNFQDGATLASGIHTVKDSSYYTLIAFGTEGNYTNVFVEDPVNTLNPAAGHAFVRYANGVTGGNVEVTINVEETVVFNNENETGFISEFKGVAPGKLTVQLSEKDGEQHAERELNFAINGVYTIVLSGDINNTDGTRPLEIKAVHYGDVTP